MHFLSAHNRSEFLAIPQLIRFDYAESGNSFEPTLLIKGSTVQLKYAVLGARMQLSFAMCNDRLLYALKVYDDGNDGGIIWSVAEREEELDGIRGLVSGEPLFAFLFNELAINVAWSRLPISAQLDRLTAWTDRAALGRVDHDAIRAAVDPMLERLHKSDRSDAEWMVLELGGQADWEAVQSRFVTMMAPPSPINLFDRDEGNHQEKLAVWLTDHILPFGVHHSPQVSPVRAFGTD